MAFVKSQLQYLWNFQMIQIIFSQLFEANEKFRRHSTSRRDSANSAVNSLALSNLQTTNNGGFIRRAIEKASVSVSRSGSGISSSGSSQYRRLGSPETTVIALICTLYETALNTLTQVKLDILTGLCYQDLVLPHLWKFICSLGPQSPMKAYLDHLTLHSKSSLEFQILTLFCNCATHLIT